MKLAGPTPTIEMLRSCPCSERHDVLEAVVTAEFKATLLMSDDEEFSLDESYFDAGFTSLRITEIKERLECLLGRNISTNVLFNSPTVERLLEHLAGEVLRDLFVDAQH